MSFDFKIKNGDFVLNNGQLQTVVDSEKLIQDILKICLTEAGADPLYPWYGSFLSRAMIGNADSNGVVIQIAKSQLNTALTNLKDLQSLQVKSFQRVSAAEQINAISDISIIRNGDDPRRYDISIKVLTKALKTVPVNFTLTTF